MRYFYGRHVTICPAHGTMKDGTNAVPGQWGGSLSQEHNQETLLERMMETETELEEME